MAKEASWVGPALLSQLNAIRKQHSIPDSHAGWFNGKGDAMFSFCDEDIVVPHDGSTPTRSWMGLNADATSHEFKTEEWK